MLQEKEYQEKLFDRASKSKDFSLEMLKIGHGVEGALEEWDKRLNAILNWDIKLHDDYYFKAWLMQEANLSSDFNYFRYVKNFAMEKI